MAKRPLHPDTFFPNPAPKEAVRMWDNLGEFSEIIENLYADSKLFEIHWKRNEVNEADAKVFNDKCKEAIIAYYKIFKGAAIESYSALIDKERKAMANEVAQVEATHKKEIQRLEQRLQEIKRY